MSVIGMRAKRAAREVLSVTKGVADMRVRYTPLSEESARVLLAR